MSSSGNRAQCHRSRKHLICKCAVRSTRGRQPFNFSCFPVACTMAVEKTQQLGLEHILHAKCWLLPGAVAESSLCQPTVL